MLDGVGLISLGFFVVSPVINDMLGHIGARIYISAISASLLAVAFLVSGSAGRGLKLPIGRYWVLFSILLAFTVPFSTWPSASLDQLEAYIPRGILLFLRLPPSWWMCPQSSSERNSECQKDEQNPVSANRQLQSQQPALTETQPCRLAETAGNLISWPSVIDNHRREQRKAQTPRYQR